VSRKSTFSKRTQRFADENLANARAAAESGRRAAKSGWNDLTDVLEGVADRTSTLAGGTKSRLKDIEREGVRRGKNAKDALTGRQPKRRRGWVAGAAAVGVGIGAAATLLARKVNAARERMRAERAATAVADDLRKADLRNSDSEPLSDAELDSLGLGARANGSTPVQPATPRAAEPNPAPSTSLGTSAGATPESRKPTS